MAPAHARPRRHRALHAAARLLALQCLLLAGAFSALAQAAERITYDIDPVHTRVLLAIDHAGFSKALGTVSGSTGRLWFDEDDWSSAAVEVVVPIARLDFGDEKWNRATLARNLLDAERYPDARFISTRIEPLGEGRARVHGMLTLHGVSREVTLDAVLNAAKRYPLPPFRRTVGFSATAMLSRSEFDVDAWPSVIGDAVELRIELEATRSRDQTTDIGEAPNAGSGTADADAKTDTDADTNREPEADSDSEAAPDPDPDPDSDPDPRTRTRPDPRP